MFDISLTFDNGPTPDVTQAVLDTLAERDIRATFFVVGHMLEAPGALNLVERARAEGHRIGNHTFSHGTPLGERPSEAAEAEIGRTQDLIGPLADPEKLFRPNGGGGHLDRRLLSRAAADYLAGHGYTCVLWNAVPRDWSEPEGWVERALDLCGQKPWSVLVLHDIASGAMRDLPAFLDRAGKAGARFRQDFPEECLPMHRGRPAAHLDHYVST